MLPDKRQVCVFAYLRSGQIISSPLVLWFEENHQGWTPIHPFLLPLPGVLTADLWWSHQTPVFHDWQSQQAGKETQPNTIKEMELKSSQRGGGTTGASNGLFRIVSTMLWTYGLTTTTTKLQPTITCQMVNFILTLGFYLNSNLCGASYRL